MRLLSTTESDTGNYEIKEFTDSRIPPYAILSHTWEQEEVLFQDMEGDGARAKSKKGFQKIKKSCFLALTSGFEYIWIDTCCIDKTSSAELSEAINSMYRWYEQAEVCFAYLADVPPARFEDSKWFTRGWTLQELIAPTTIEFYDATWSKLKSKKELQQALSNCTSIPAGLLSGDNDLDDFCVAQKMSWAAKRETTRIEDRAYSLMGLFGVNIPLLYGERTSAFIRLQEEIIRIKDDHTIFAWRHEEDQAGLLATCPEAFASSHNIIPFTPFGYRGAPVTLSSRGIYLELNFTGVGGEALGLAILHCKYQDREDGLIAIYLKDVSLTMEHFRRVDSGRFAQVDLTKSKPYPYPMRRLCVQAGRMRSKGKQFPENEESSVTMDVSLYDKLCSLIGRDDLAKSLHNAVASGDKDAVWLLLTRGDIATEWRDKSGRTPLFLATQIGHEHIVKMLLARGAQINAQDNHALTPLMRARQCGYKDLETLLISRGAQINKIDERGRVPMMRYLPQEYLKMAEQEAKRYRPGRRS